MALFDIARFTAALAVVAYHFAYSCAAEGRTTLQASQLDGWCRYGYLGVDVFFVISGYFILLTADGRDWRHFAAARVSRLYPALAVCGLATFVISAWWEAWCFRPLTYRDLAAHLTSLVFVPGMGSRFTYLDLVYWTLAIEFKYYALLFVGMLVGVRFTWFLTGVLVLYAVGFACAGHPVARILEFGGFSGHFVVGGALYLIASERRQPWPWMLLVVGLLVVMGHVYRTAAAGVSCDPWIACGIVAACLGILCLAGLGMWTPRWRWAAFLGELTYPLYLIHHQIGCVIGNRLGVGDSVLAFVCFTAASVAAAVLVVVLVERPLIPRMRRAILRPLSPRTA